MKVLQINAVYGYDSTGIIVKEIEQELLKNNEKAFVAYQFTRGMPSNPYRLGNIVDWKFHALYTRVMGKQAYASVLSTKKFLSYLDKIKPDIVHLHNVHSNCINLNMLLKYLADNNIATVLTLHDNWFFTGKCFHFVGSCCEKWKTGCGNCPKNKDNAKSWFFDQSAKVFKDKLDAFQAIQNLTVVGCSKWISDNAKCSPVFNNKFVTYIYNGIDTQTFKPIDKPKFRVQNHINDKFVILGMANKWFVEKNKKVVDSLIKNLSDDEVIVIVGCNDKQKKIFNNNSKIITVGFVRDRYELADIYSSADVFVNLTLEDTLPTVNMESIACATPVIAYDTCGGPELIDDNKTGFVIPVLDSVSLINKISEVKNGKISRQVCRETAVSRFERQRMRTEYLNLYRKVITK